MKAWVAYSLAAGLTLTAAPAPAEAQDARLTARVLVEVCLPYATRQKSFERAIRSARDLRFRSPSNDRAAPLDEWATEVELVSRDGTWRLHLEEGTVFMDQDRQAYGVTCSLSSSRASARQLSELGRRAFRNERYWVGDDGELRAWDRRTSNPEEYRLEVRVSEEPGERPALSIQGLYF